MSKTTTSAARRQAGTTTTQRTATRTRRNTGGASGRAFHMPFEDKNVIIILIGVGIIGLGYLLMSMGDVMGFTSLTLAPIVLCIGYLVVVPYGIMYGPRAARKAREEKLVIEEKTINNPTI